MPEGFESCGELGRGGMGVIYRARQGERTVALKMIRSSNLPGPAEVARFRAEIRAVSQLDHPHIVPIFHEGEVDGLPYYSMKLMEGALSDSLPRFKGDSVATARLVAGIARGVQHAHERGILHRDLKPGNVLLDREGVPYVADFGMAKLVQDGPSSQSGILGTPSYMAPEQARGDARGVTTATDVYALGAILFEVLTGRPPFEAETVTELLQKVVAEDAPKPGSLAAHEVPIDLETICSKCLEKEPGRRYRTALEVAEELERFMAGEPILARPLGAVGRLARLARRHPFVLAAAAGVMLLLAGVAVAAVSVARSQEEDLRRSALDANVFAARAVAGSVLYQLSRQASQSRQCLDDAALGQASLEADGCAHRADLSGRLRRCVEPFGFDSVALMDVRGRVIARWPIPDFDYFCTDFEWRDYFRGARRLGEAGRRETYVSRAYKSEADGGFKFALANPVFGPGGAWQGVLIATVGTSSALGALDLGDPNDRRRLGVLVGLRDNDRATARAPLPQEYLVLLHESLEHGRAVPMPAGSLQLSRDLGSDSFAAPPAERAVRLEDHRDPMTGFEGRWLAGMAPVGSTPFLVLVQTSDDAVLDINKTLWSWLTWGGAGLACGLAALAAALWLARRLARRA
ncbi:MAG TPA: serine/threonine protein kinase [Myxococcales bacterium]|jgi:serine/threonine-protein kinase